jgi:hypothetical protein
MFLPKEAKKFGRIFTGISIEYVEKDGKMNTVLECPF